MKMIVVLFIFMACGALRAEFRHKETFVLEYGKKYDSNIVLPDSVTYVSALITEASVKPAFLLQFTPRTMLRLNALLSSEESNEFTDCTIRKARPELQFKHLFSHLTMAGARFSYDLNASSYRYYDYDRIEAALEGGRYLNPRTNVEAVFSVKQMTYPRLYRTSLSDILKKSYYYDWREAGIQFSLRRVGSRGASLAAVAGAAVRDYFHDVHDSDYVGFDRVPQDTFLNIIPGGYDTVFSNYQEVPLYGENIHQKDVVADGSFSVTVNPGERVLLWARLYARVTPSNDDYFTSLFMSPSIKGSWAFEKMKFSCFYFYDWEMFPDRKEYNPEGEREEGHYLGVEYEYRIGQGLDLTLGAYYRRFDSSFNPEDFEKKMAGAAIRYSR